VIKLKTLSKTRFKLALECPTKVFYSLDDRYTNRRQDDEFLEALAKGGYQVGALAKLMFRAQDSDAVEITAVDQESQVRETKTLLERTSVTIFEATILHDNLVVRVDVLAKRGSQVDLIGGQVKVLESQYGFVDRRDSKTESDHSDWEPYVYDVAFQERVLALAYPAFAIRPWLMLVDKSRPNTVAGLPLSFRLQERGATES